MTGLRRLTELLRGVLMLVMALSLFFIKAEYAINLALAFIGIGMTLRGMGVIIYYLTMTRYMVGGRYTLYWGIIYLELGILSGSLAGHPAVYAIIYIAMVSIFSGVVSVLRANESRASGGHWRLRLAYGIAEVLMAAAVIAGGLFYGNTTLAAYIYGAGLIYSAVLRIISAFRRTDIVYIQ